MKASQFQWKFLHLIFYSNAMIRTVFQALNHSYLEEEEGIDSFIKPLQ